MIDVSWAGKIEEKKRLEKVYKAMPVTRYTPRGVFVDISGRYVRYYPYSSNHGVNNKKIFQRIANRKTRRRLGNEEAAPRGSHKKLFDLWWTIT